MIGNEFASFDGSIESFFDAAAKEQKEKKWRCQIEKREQCNQMVKKASFIKVEKTFHLTRMRTTTTLTDCSKLQASSLELQCAKSIPYHQSPAPRNQKSPLKKVQQQQP